MFFDVDPGILAAVLELGRVGDAERMGEGGSRHGVNAAGGTARAGLPTFNNLGALRLDGIEIAGLFQLCKVASNVGGQELSYERDDFDRALFDADPRVSEAGTWDITLD